MKKLTKAFPHREGAGRADEVESGSFRQPSYNTCHCEPVRRLVWQSVLPRFPSFSLVLPRSPLAPTLGELAAEPTERVKIALPAPLGHLSHRERQVALIRLALAGDARATFTLWSNCHWQLLDFNSLRGAPPHRGRLWARIARRGSRLMSTGRTAWE